VIGEIMTIRRLLRDDRLREPEDAERLDRAYRYTLRSLCLVGRNDPVTEIVAKAVIEIGATDVRDPIEISKIAVKQLGNLIAGSVT
jgi:hypothetical protein